MEGVSHLVTDALPQCREMRSLVFRASGDEEAAVSG
jgi:hypothetical protein